MDRDDRDVSFAPQPAEYSDVSADTLQTLWFTWFFAITPILAAILAYPHAGLLVPVGEVC
jgi:hypothetical protein